MSLPKIPEGWSINKNHPRIHLPSNNIARSAATADDCDPLNPWSCYDFPVACFVPVSFRTPDGIKIQVNASIQEQRCWGSRLIDS
ncbi:MAG: hypothetical protein M2R45_02752 [Verrucomicrobia subdivision 3 bacterium]|nr:hypothetical protein [Limisphaerales bacterium]